MLTWLVNNLATIIVGLALLAVVILIVKKLRSDKKKVNLPVVVIAQDVRTANIAIINKKKGILRYPLYLPLWLV